MEIRLSPIERIRMLLFITVASLCVSLFAKPQSFGKKVSKEQLTPISELLANVDKFDKKEVTIKGMVTNVCSMRGCWMEFASDKEYQTLKIKVRDGDMVFPVSAKGKMAYATGTLNQTTLSKAQLISYAEKEAQKSGKPADLSHIKGPETYYQFIPVGVTIE